MANYSEGRDKTSAARAATKRIRMAMPPEERKALAIRLLAIGNGKRSQAIDRRKGFDRMAYARSFKRPKHLRVSEKCFCGAFVGDCSHERTRSKVNPIE